MGILQARILEWVEMPFSRRPSWPSNWTHVSYISCIGRRFFTTSATWKTFIYVYIHNILQYISSVAQACPTLQPHGQQHARPPCQSPTPRVYCNSSPSSWWCHPTIYLILCHPLLLPPSIFPSIRIFSNELVLCIRWPKYWSFSFSISPSNEYPGLISFRMDWLDLLTVQGTLKSLLQHHSAKASILQCSAFL